MSHCLLPPAYCRLPPSFLLRTRQATTPTKALPIDAIEMGSDAAGRHGGATVPKSV